MSFTLNTGDKAPDFSLLGTDGQLYSLESFEDAKLLVIFFTCNDCPHVRASDENTKEIAEKFAGHGVQFCAINSNDAFTKPQDSFIEMLMRSDEMQFPWPYLRDEDSQVALQYGALRTPHFFLFDQNRCLIYTGCGLESPKNPLTSIHNYLEEAIEEQLSGKAISDPITNPVGCNIKWKGHDASWMPPEASDLLSM